MTDASDHRTSPLERLVAFMSRPATVLVLGIVGITVALACVLLRILAVEMLDGLLSEGVDLRGIAFWAGMVAVIGALPGRSEASQPRARGGAAEGRAASTVTVALVLGTIAVVVAIVLYAVGIVGWLLQLAG